jgi:hypothetical protein
MSLFNRIVAVTFLSACATRLPHPSPASTASQEAVDDGAMPAADGEESASYLYSPMGRRDPFAGANAHLAAADTDCRKSSLPYEAEQLKLVFTETGSSSPMAMVVDPAGKDHMLHPGDVVGHNCGVVSDITHDDVSFTDTFSDATIGAAYTHVHRLRMTPPSSQPDFEGHESSPTRAD